MSRVRITYDYGDALVMREEDVKKPAAAVLYEVIAKNADNHCPGCEDNLRMIMQLADKYSAYWHRDAEGLLHSIPMPIGDARTLMERCRGILGNGNAWLKKADEASHA